MFDEFATTEIDTGEATIFVRHGGSGPPLLLHGYPQTHVMWHRVAPKLAEDFTVVAPDVRGYGASAKPPPTANHAPYAKRAMSDDQVAVMTALGFDRFLVAGHDRGARVGYLLALDQTVGESRCWDGLVRLRRPGCPHLREVAPAWQGVPHAHP